MIVFVTITTRRFLVLDVPPFPTGWAAAVALKPAGLGFRHVSAPTRIAGPCSWKDAMAAASQYAEKTGQLVKHEVWHAEADLRMKEMLNDDWRKRGSKQT